MKIETIVGVGVSIIIILIIFFSSFRLMGDVEAEYNSWYELCMENDTFMNENKPFNFDYTNYSHLRDCICSNIAEHKIGGYE